MKTIKVSSPTRVDLAGGTLDLWPLYAFLGECHTINVAISIYTHATLKERADKKIVLNIQDLNAVKTYSDLNECLADEDEKFVLLRHHVEFWKPNFGFELTTSSESPIGGGLGGSSSLSVSICSAFSHFLNRKLSVDELVRIVGNIEARVLKMPTGTQDYYPPILGGLNSLNYTAEGCHVESLKFDEDIFNQSFLLAYTGRPHHSGFNNWQVLKDAIDGHQPTLEALKDIQGVSQRLLQSLRQNNWNIAELLLAEFEARVRISPVFTSPEIERLKSLSLRHGAEAVKICGAGGGGCVLIWSKPHQKNQLKELCQKEGFQILNAMPVLQGRKIEEL